MYLALTCLTSSALGTNAEIHYTGKELTTVYGSLNYSRLRMG